jgi:hypothetical protein
MSRLVVAFLGFVLLTVPACAGKKQTDTDFDNYAPLAEAIAKADKAVLYEGLPHQSYAHELLKKELQEKKTVEHHGFPFYADPLDLKGDGATKLIATFTDPGSFRKWHGAKACGGFHPDFLVEYHAGEDTYRMLVCLGCHEVKVFGPTAELYCDLTDAGYEAFRTLLRGYVRHRPDSKSQPWY